MFYSIFPRSHPKWQGGEPTVYPWGTGIHLKIIVPETFEVMQFSVDYSPNPLHSVHIKFS